MRDYNAWFRYRVVKAVKEDNSKLFDSKIAVWSSKLSYRLGHKNCWVIVVGGVFLFFTAAVIIDIPCIDILNLEFANAKIIIDQRTTNIAAIISMSLVVVGFLINNLAVKSPITYGLLFRKTYLYFTIYLTCTIIAFFMVVSLLRDSITEFIFIRAVIAASYLALSIPILIGFLFRKLILFTNEKRISNMLKDELIDEGRKKLRSILIQRHSREMYPKLFDDFAEPEFNIPIMNFLQGNIKFEPVDQMPTEKKKKLEDVNVWLLKVLLNLKKLSTEELFFARLVLEDNIEAENDIIWSNTSPNSKIFKWFLRRCIRTSKASKNIDEDAYRIEFDNKILQLAEEGRYQNLETTLDAYYELYDLQIANQK